MAVVLFFVFGGLAVLGALGVLACRNPIHSAMSLVGTMVSLAVIYLLHHAEFIFAIQLMVYAGAVMMLVVFVIMLLDIQRESTPGPRLSGGKIIGLVWAGLLFVLLVVPLGARLTGAVGPMTVDTLMEVGSVEYLAGELFTTYLLPFEAAGILLLVGLVGAVALAKKKL